MLLRSSPRLTALAVLAATSAAALTIPNFAVAAPASGDPGHVASGPNAAASVDRPRRNLRLALAMGQSLVLPPLCSGCERFWGPALGAGIEVGWTLRPNLVLALEEQVTLVRFADRTYGSLRALQLSALYFWRPRAWLRGAAGLGRRAMHPEEDASPRARTWSQPGPAVTFGIGQEATRVRAWSLTLEARATAVFAGGVAPGLLLLAGGAWN